MDFETIDKEAKTSDEAVELALIELDAKRDDVDVEILQESSRGLLGMGAKNAKVRVTLKESATRTSAKDALSKILELMGIEATVRETADEDGIRLDVESPDSAILIGRKGKNLSGLQYIVNRIHNRGGEHDERVVIDVEGYVSRRQESLREMALKFADKVKSKKTEVKVELLNPQDRRVIHLALQDNPNVRTYSVGTGNYRHVVIAPARNNKKQGRNRNNNRR